MAFPPRVWVNGEIVDDVNMNRIEQGISDASTDYTETIATAPAGSVFASPLDGSTSTDVDEARPSNRADLIFEWRMTVWPNNLLPGDRVFIVVP